MYMYLYMYMYMYVYVYVYVYVFVYMYMYVCIYYLPNEWLFCIGMLRCEAKPSVFTSLYTADLNYVNYI